MAGDTNSNIFINIDTAQAMAQLRALEKELTALNRALITGTKTAAQAQAKYTQGLLHNVNATGQWTASTVRMSTASEQFATALDRSKLSLKEYFRYGMASTKTFGRVFGSEFDTVSKLVQKRVKTLQQQYVQLGRDASGAMNAVKFTPKNLNYRDVTTQLMMATQRQQIFNKLLDDGATKLLNFGKNTQWAGRQLMVGFTIPLMLFGTQAIRTFKEIETQTIRFKKVYGDLFTDQGATDEALKNIRALADEYTKYGLKVSETVKMSADAAAAGFTGKALEDLVEQTNKLAVLGGIAQDKALETTIALRSAFRVDEGDLKGTIDFLNAVENQTVLALEDVTEAVPRVGPIIKQLGGNVQDLAFFLTAMKEGGVSAAQGANALKSGLASLINPSDKASKAAAELGINIKGIIEANQGNLRNTVLGFAKALEPLEELQRTRIIEQIFGKFQFARISALLNNITDEGTQAARVLDLTNRSTAELALLSERELGVAASSAMNKFAGAVERLKAGIAPVGEIFAKTLTPVIEFITKMAERFNKLPDGMKKGIAIIVAIVGGLGPVFLMTFGLLANALANVLKGFNLLRKGYQNLAYGSSDAALRTQYLTNEELENISVTNALYSSHDRLSAAYRLESTALGALIAQYTSATAAMRNFSVANPGLFIPGRGRGVPPIRRAGGGTVSGPGTATSDSIPAYLSDGEYVVNAKAVDAYGVETFDALNARKLAAGGPAMRDGIPRLFTGGWMNRIVQSMMPKTRFGVMQGADGFAISGFAGGARRSGLASSSQPLPKINLPKIPWIEDAKNPNNLIIRDPSSGQEFTIPKTSKAAYDKMYNDLVIQGKIQKRGDRPEMSPTEYLMYRLLKKHKQGKPLTAQQVLGQAGTAGKSRVRIQGASKGGAYSRWGRAVDKPKVRSLQRFFDSEKDHLRKVLPRETFDELEKNNLFVVSPSHIRGAGANRNATDWSADKVLRDTSLVNFGLNYMTRGKRLSKATPHPTTQAEADKIISAIELLKAQGPLAPTLQGTLEALKYRKQTGFYSRYDPTDVGLELKAGGMIQKLAGGMVGIGMPTAFAKVQQGRMLAQQIDARVRSSRFREMAPTDFGVKIKDTSGHSFPIPGVGGIYRKPNGDLAFVKPVMDEKAALAEQRATIIARKAHGLNAPKQTIRTMIDPTDLTRKRKFLVLESPYDANLGKGGKEFTKDEYFKQLVASTLRGDKDLSPSNVFGGTLADVGTAGVFARASGKRDYSFNMPSMAEQAMTNLLGIKGGAKRAFAESTADMIRKMNPAAYRKEMIKEIDAVLPRLKDTVKSFGLTGVEKILYERMIARLQAGRKVDWTKYHAIHSKVKPKKYATGVFSVPGPKGAGDVVPAMLSPGESVIPTAQTQKYQPLIRSIIADNVPGFGTGDPNVDAWGDDPNDKPKRAQKGSMRYGLNYLRPSNIVASARGGSLGSQIGAAAREIGIATARATATGAKKAGQAALTVADKRMQAFMADNTEELKNNTKATEDGSEKTTTSTKQQQKNERQQKMMMRTQRMMLPSMGLAMAGPMLAMSQQQKNPEGFIGRNADAIMMSTIAASILLPLINNLKRGLIAGVAALGIAIYLHRKSIENAISQAVAFGNSLTNTVKTLEAFGAVTGRVSATQVQAEKRAQRMTGLSPYDLSFGADFLKGEAGQEFRKEFIKSTEGLTSGNATDILSSRLAQAVSQNVLSYDEAESFGLAIARSLNDTNMELSVVANLRQILGPEGQDLINNPLDVQMRLIANNKQLNDQFLAKLNSTVEKEFGINRNELFGLIGGAAVGAGAGALGGAMLRSKLVGEGTRGAVGSVATAKSAYQSSLVARGAAPAVSSIKAAGITGAKATRTLSTGSKALLGLRAAGIGATATGGGAMIGIPAIIASIAAEQLVRYFQRGQERKEVGKVSGTLVGSGTGSIRDIGMGISSIRETADIKVQQLENELAMTKEAQKRLEIEKQINDIKTQEDADVESLTKSRQESLNQMLAYRDSIQDKGAIKIFDDAVGIQTKQRIKGLEGFQKTQAENLKLYMMGGAFASGKGKASPEQLAAAQAKIDEALAQLKPGVVDLQKQQRVSQLINEKQKLENQKFDTGRLSAQIQFLLNAEMGVTDAQVLSLLEFAERTKQNPQYYIDIIAGLEDPAAITGIIKDFMDNDDTIQVFLDIVTKAKGKKGGVTEIKNLTDGLYEFIKAKKGLADEFGPNAIDIDNLFKGSGYKADALFGQNGIINSQNLLNAKDEVQRMSSEIGKINTKLDKSKWSKATTDQRKQMLLDVKESYRDSSGKVLPNKTIDDAIANWGKISTLDRDVQLQAVFTTQVIVSTEMQDEVRTAVESAFIKEVPSRKDMKFIAPDLYAKDFEAWARKNADKVRTIAETFKGKTYDVLFGPGGVLNPNPVDPKDDVVKGPKLDLSWLNELVQRLKLTKERTLESLSPLSSLKKFLSDTTFSKVNEDLEKQRGLLKLIENQATKAGTSLAVNLVELLKSADPVQFKLLYEFLFNAEGQLKENGKIINEAFKVDTLSTFLQKQKESNEALEGQAKTFNKLIALGYGMEEVLRIIQDETLAVEIANGNAFSKEELEQYNAELKKTADLNAQIAVQAMTKQLPGIQDQVKVLEKLTGLGFNYADSLKIIKDKALVASIALETDPDKIKSLVNASLDFADVLSMFEEISKTPQQRVQEEINRAMADLDLQARTLENNFNRDKDVIALQAKIELSEKTIEELNNDIQTKQDDIDKINVVLKYDKEIGQNVVDDIQETLSDLQRKIDLEYDRPIQALSDRSNILSNDLSLIDRASEAINEKYDKQEESLNKISELNQEIAEQEKNRISLADALSQGDISAAAQMAIEMRSSAAQAANTRSADILGASRELELERLLSASGMTRKQIEQEQFNIGQRTFLLEQERKKLQDQALIIEDRLYNIQESREAELLKIRDIETSIDFIKNGTLLTEELSLRQSTAELKVRQDALDAALKAINQQKLDYEATQIQLDNWSQKQDALNKGPLQSAKDLTAAILSDFVDLIAIASQEIIVKIKAVYEGFKGVAGGDLYTGKDYSDDEAARKAAEAKAKAEADAKAKAEADAKAKAEADAKAKAEAKAKAALSGSLIAISTAKTQDAINAAVKAATESAKSASDIANAMMVGLLGQGIDAAAAGSTARYTGMAIAAMQTAEANKAASYEKFDPGRIGFKNKGGLISYMAQGGMIRAPRAEPAPTQKMNMGGLISYMSNGGIFKPLGTDTVPAMLTPGEFVMSRYAVENYGLDKMKAINNGTSDTESVYNYSVNVNVKSGSNPDEIARAVMTQIKQIDSQRIRGQRVS